MGIRHSTLADWKTKYPDISGALKRGKKVVDIEVENALLKRAKGVEYTEKRMKQSAKDGRKVTLIKLFVPPETAAAIFWLKNRESEKWREKQAEQHSAETNDDDNFHEAVAEAVK